MLYGCTHVCVADDGEDCRANYPLMNYYDCKKPLPVCINWRYLLINLRSFVHSEKFAAGNVVGKD